MESAYPNSIRLTLLVLTARRCAAAHTVVCRRTMSVASSSNVNRTARAWCFTSYVEFIASDYPQSVRYVVAQRERCPSTGREHWQGYIEFGNAVRRKTVQRAIGDLGAHAKPRFATREAARAYCMKPDTAIAGTLFEWGTWEDGGQGARTDISAACVALRTGGLKRVAEEHPAAFVKYHAGFAALERALAPDVPSERDLRVEAWIGKTGTGKTQTAVRTFPGAYKWVTTGKDLWFCGYARARAADVIILDDFAGGMPLPFLLQFLDKYNLDLPIKGSSVPARYTKVIITSNLDVDMWFPSADPEHQAALARRIHNIQRSAPYKWEGWAALPHVPTPPPSPPRPTPPAVVDLVCHEEWDEIQELLDRMVRRDSDAMELPCICTFPGGGGGGGTCGAPGCVNIPK